MNLDRFVELVGPLELAPGTESAIRELENRGLSFCVHFGYENAQDVLSEMDRAFTDGELYEWMRKRMGIQV